MKKIDETELDNIKGGTNSTITSSMINAIVNVVELLEESGYRIGSAIRRLSEGKLCPLD